MSLTAGIVAVQGATRAHEAAFARLEASIGREIDVRPARSSGVIPSCDIVAMPGGESTTISRLIDSQGLAEELREHIEQSKPLLATCAGLIVAASDPGDDRVDGLGLLDVSVERNAFGRQRDSFEAPITVAGLEEPFPAVFIRAPVITDPGETTVLASHADRPVAVRSGSIVATSFHPELTEDDRLHRLVLEAGR